VWGPRRVSISVSRCRNHGSMSPAAVSAGPANEVRCLPEATDPTDMAAAAAVMH